MKLKPTFQCLRATSDQKNRELSHSFLSRPLLIDHLRSIILLLPPLVILSFLLFLSNNTYTAPTFIVEKQETEYLNSLQKAVHSEIYSKYHRFNSDRFGCPSAITDSKTSLGLHKAHSMIEHMTFMRLFQLAPHLRSSSSIWASTFQPNILPTNSEL